MRGSFGHDLRVPWAERIFRLAVRLYPREFRSRYEPEILVCFQARHRALRTGGGARSGWAYALRASLDVAGSALAEHWERSSCRRRHGFAAGGAAGSGALAAAGALYCLCCLVPWPFGESGERLALDLYQHRDPLLQASLVGLVTSFWVEHRPPQTGTGTPTRRSGSASTRIVLWVGVGIWFAALAAPRLVALVHPS